MSMKIGELARQAQINPRTLRYYERIGLLVPSARTAAGYRLYTARTRRGWPSSAVLRSWGSP